MNTIRCALFSIALSMVTSPVQGGSYIFAGEANGIDLITHPTGYDGTGGSLTVGVCIDNTSANAAEMIAPVRNLVETLNNRQAITQNLFFGNENNLSSSQIDFESVALHEVGHCVGLAHVNAASESGLSGSDRNYTKATDGADDEFNIDAGTDGIIGSSDDVRGDDVNLHWFNTDNDPCNLFAGTADSTTFSRGAGDLPAFDNFAANADRAVCGDLGVADTEAVMQQGTFFDEDQRAMMQDGVSTLNLSMTGLDETAGTADDYTLELVSHGAVTDPADNPGCDVIIDFDDSRTAFALCSAEGIFLNTTHVAITIAEIFFNSGIDFFFNNGICSHGPKMTGTDLTLNDISITGAQRFRASDTITTGEAFSVGDSACVNFSAATSITLGPGFSIENGGVFRAAVEP